MDILTFDQILDFFIFVLQVVGLSLGFTLLIVAALFFVPFLEAREQRLKREQFSKVLKNGIRKKEITSNDLRHIAARWNQDRKSILFNLRGLLSDYFMQEKEGQSKNEEHEKSKEYIRKLLEDHEKDEPFAELPKNIGLQLNSIQKSLNETDSDKIEQLASSLSILYASNVEEISKQKLISKASLFLGVLGVLLTIIIFFLPKILIRLQLLA